MIFLNVRTRFCCHIDLLTHREAVTGYPAGHRLASLYTTKELFSLLVVCVRFIDTFALHRVLMSMTLLSLLCS